MKQLHALFVRAGTVINPWLLAVIAVAVNVYWVIVLQAFNGHFQQIAGYPLLDLQNDIAPETIITPAKVLEQLTSYTLETKTLYWAFFILDTIFPPLAFASIALLWVYFLKSNPNPLFDWLLRSWFVLIPVGVGVFDWFENLGYLIAIHNDSNVVAGAAVTIGLVFKWLKAACVFPTFPVLLLLAMYHGFNSARRRIAAKETIPT